MIISEPTPKGAGLYIWGDALDLSSLHETIHFLADAALFGTLLSDFMLGLAYDVRKAYEGQREKKIFNCETAPGRATYKGERILWPYFLIQIGMLRHSAAFHPTTALMQSHLYQLEACAEKALLDYHAETGRQCLEWLSRFPGFPRNFLVEFINCQIRDYTTAGKPGIARFKKLPALLKTISPMSDAYQQFDGAISTSAAQNACSPDDFHDKGDWPDFQW